MLIHIDIQVLNSAIVALHELQQSRLEHLAGSAPACASLNQDWTFRVCHSCLPVFLRVFHLLDVGTRINGSRCAHHALGHLKIRSAARRSTHDLCSQGERGDSATSSRKDIFEHLLWIELINTEK